MEVNYASFVWVGQCWPPERAGIRASGALRLNDRNKCGCSKTGNSGASLRGPNRRYHDKVAAGRRGGFSLYPTTPLTASGGSGSYTFSLVGGALPTGISFASNGSLSGTPTQAGAFAPIFTATDTSRSPQTSKPVTLALKVDPAVTVTTSSLGIWRFGVVHSVTLGASGGTGGYIFTSTALPTGLSLNGNVISGTPGAGWRVLRYHHGDRQGGALGKQGLHSHGASSGRQGDNALASKREFWAALRRGDDYSLRRQRVLYVYAIGAAEWARARFELGRNLWRADTSGNLHRHHHRDGHHPLARRWSLRGNEAPYTEGNEADHHRDNVLAAAGHARAELQQWSAYRLGRQRVLHLRGGPASEWSFGNRHLDYWHTNSVRKLCCQNHRDG